MTLEGPGFLHRLKGRDRGAVRNGGSFRRPPASRPPAEWSVFSRHSCCSLFFTFLKVKKKWNKEALYALLGGVGGVLNNPTGTQSPDCHCISKQRIWPRSDRMLAFDLKNCGPQSEIISPSAHSGVITPPSEGQPTVSMSLPWGDAACPWT